MHQGENDTNRVSQHVQVTSGQRIQEISSCLATLPRHSQTRKYVGGEMRTQEKRSSEEEKDAE